MCQDKYFLAIEIVYTIWYNVNKSEVYLWKIGWTASVLLSERQRLRG